MPPSPNQHLILGLNLLHLLVENRLAEFHCEVCCWTGNGLGSSLTGLLWQLVALYVLSPHPLYPLFVGGGVEQLELVDEADRTNGLIAYPVMLEEWLMEGSYNKVLDGSDTSHVRTPQCPTALLVAVGPCFPPPSSTTRCFRASRTHRHPTSRSLCSGWWTQYGASPSSCDVNLTGSRAVSSLVVHLWSRSTWLCFAGDWVC